MANPPLPAISPPSVSTLSGGTWANGPVQTASSSTLQDWAETRQWMHIDYTRNPVQTYEPNEPPAYRSLTTVSSTDRYNVYATQLHQTVRVHNSCTKITQDYSTTSYHQPQKFAQLVPQVGKEGYYYGPGIGTNNSQYLFGAMGTIHTFQPYIHRVAWDDAVHSEYSITVQGTSHATKISGDETNPAAGPGNWGQSGDVFQPYTMYLHSTPQVLQDLQYSPQFPFARFITGPTGYLFGGGYATSSEVGYQNNVAGRQNLIDYIEQTGTTIQQVSPTQPRGYCKLNPTQSDGFDHIVQADRIPANPYYDMSRHDYS